MPSANSNLRTLVSELPLVIANLNTSIDNIDSTTRELLNQQQAIEQSVMGVMTSASDDWTAWKATDLGTGATSAFGDYGVLNVTDWHIYDTTVTPKGPHVPGYVLYTSGDVTSAGPAQDNTEARQYNRQIEFPLAYEHINDSLGVSPGTYGIVEKITALERGRLLQVNNEAKYTEVLKIYDDYTGSPPTGT